MNAVLPSGVELYLKEAGFSATEMLLLRKLVEEDSLTIRELASKTGKSTGVLDQAMKKLIVKKIAQKNNINDQPRYSINSLDAVLRWVKEDMVQRKTTLERRHENFESFIATLKVDKKRPDIEHYHGSEGIKQAYLKLLESGQELLTCTPILTLAEDDPFRMFRVEYFRKRQVRKIFQRVIAPDSMFARRFQSRDPFEYRKTLLIPETDLPLTFEKTIVGDIIACFNFQQETACFLKYPDLAKAERDQFESLWAKKLHHTHSDQPQTSVPTKIPLSTRIFSSLREFVLSRRSLAVFVVFALLSGALTFGLYKNNRELNFQRLRAKTMAIATTSALQFDANDIEAIRGKEDIDKPEYAKLVATLNLVRRSDPDIRYAYIMRKTPDPMTLSFVADADSLRPHERIDLNNDGIFNAADALSYPGDLYDVSRFPELVEGFNRPYADNVKQTDQWGTFISGYAPIRDKTGLTVAVLGFDFLGTELDKLTAESFTPVYFFFAFFLLFLFIRLVAFNKSLLGECVEAMNRHRRKIFLWTLFVLCLAFGMVYAMRIYARQQFIEETGKRLMAIAVTAANDFDPNDLNQLHFARDMKTEAYQRVFKKLNDLRNKNPEIEVSYFVRPTKDPMLFEFVANSDINYNLPQYFNTNINDTKLNQDSDESPWPGYIYEDYFPVFRLALKRPAYGYAPIDKWGSTITGMAPIFQNGILAGILSIDVVLDKNNDLN